MYRLCSTNGLWVLSYSASYYDIIWPPIMIFIAPNNLFPFVEWILVYLHVLQEYTGIEFKHFNWDSIDKIWDLYKYGIISYLQPQE